MRYTWRSSECPPDITKTLPIPGVARAVISYGTALPPGFGGFNRVSEIYPEDILKNPVPTDNKKSVAFKHVLDYGRKFS